MHDGTTRGIKNCRFSRLFKGCSPLQLLCNLISNRPQSATFHSVPRSRTAAKYSSACFNQDGGNSCKLNHRCHFAGRGIKPPKGAVVKSHGAERLG